MKVNMEYTGESIGVVYQSEDSADDIFDAISNGEHIVFSFTDGGIGYDLMSMISAESGGYVYLHENQVLELYDSKLCYIRDAIK